MNKKHTTTASTTTIGGGKTKPFTTSHYTASAPAGFTSTIPVNGPVYIMRGAVYLDEAKYSSNATATGNESALLTGRRGGGATQQNGGGGGGSAVANSGVKGMLTAARQNHTTPTSPTRGGDTTTTVDNGGGAQKSTKGVSFAADGGSEQRATMAMSSGSGTSILVNNSFTANGSNSGGGGGMGSHSSSPPLPQLPSLMIPTSSTAKHHSSSSTTSANGAGTGSSFAIVAPKSSIFNAVDDVNAGLALLSGSRGPPSHRSGCGGGGFSGSTFIASLHQNRGGGSNNNQSASASASAMSSPHSLMPQPQQQQRHLLKPLLPHQTTPLDALARSAENFIESELNLLAASAERDLVGYKAATAQAYSQGVRMILPQLNGVLGGGGSGGGFTSLESSMLNSPKSPHSLNGGGSAASPKSSYSRITHLIEKCLRNFEDALQSAAYAASQPTRSAEERSKMEQEMKSIYLQASEDRSRELDRRQAEIENSSLNTAQRVVQLENQLASAKQEIQRLRSNQEDDSDRYSNMTQSVLESRLAAQKAEIALQEMKNRYDRVKITEMVYMDLLRDHQDMVLILTDKKIEFKSRIAWKIDELLLDPTAEILGRHATAIRAKQEEEIKKTFGNRR